MTQPGCVKTLMSSARSGGNQGHAKAKWSLDHKIRLVELEKEERAKGSGFMKSLKRRWDSKFPELQHFGEKALRNNAAVFHKDPKVMRHVEEIIDNSGYEHENVGKHKWKMDEMLHLVEIDDKERSKGRGFMRRVHERWLSEFPGRFVGAGTLRDLAQYFRSQNEIATLLLVKRNGGLEGLKRMLETER